VTQPLDGVRVLDLTHALAGPFCTYQLQMLGADVIKVEPPGEGDDFRLRPAVFAAVNGGKRSVVLDLKSPYGQTAFRKLAETSDVLVENYRPGVTRNLGIDWDSVQPLNARLIYCSISGYGQTGPLRDYPAIEWAVQAMSGMSAGYISSDVDGAYLGLGVLDPFSGYVAFSAILAALLQRQQTDEGQRIDVSMLDGAMLLMASRVAGQAFSDGAASGDGRRPTMVRFRAKDRRVFIGALHRKWFEKLCHIIGAPELLDDPRFANARAQAENADALIEAIEARLALRPAADWERELVQAGLPAAVIRPLSEALEHPHLAQDPSLVEVESPHFGKSGRVVGSAFHMAHDGPRLQGPVPRLGEHTSQVLTELGITTH